jgi:plastocyanin
MKRTIYPILACASLLLALAYTVSTGSQTPIPNAHASSQTITLRGSFASGWNGTNPRPTITITQGETITLNLISGDGAPHTLIIDVAHAGVIPSPNCSIDKCSSQFSSSTTFAFVADIATGTYSYYCSIHLQHMTGSLVVQAGSNGQPDFSARSTTTSLNIAQGSSGTATLSLTSLNGFTGTVALTATVSPSGPGVSLSSSNVMLPAGGSASAMLTVSTASTGIYSTPVADGTYTVMVSEASGSITHSTTVTVNVGTTTAGPSSSGSGSTMPAYSIGSSGTLLLAGAAILVVLAVTGTIVVVARRRRM